MTIERALEALRRLKRHEQVNPDKTCGCGLALDEATKAIEELSPYACYAWFGGFPITLTEVCGACDGSGCGNPNGKHGTHVVYPCPNNCTDGRVAL